MPHRQEKGSYKYSNNHGDGFRQMILDAKPITALLNVSSKQKPPSILSSTAKYRTPDPQGSGSASLKLKRSMEYNYTWAGFSFPRTFAFSPVVGVGINQ